MREADLDLYDAYNADEAFLTSTSLCICPITRINGVTMARGPRLGTGHAAACRRYRDYVGHDFVGQYLKRYVEGAQARAF